MRPTPSYSDLVSLLQNLLSIGRNESFEDLSRYPEFQDHASVLRLADVYRDKVLAFAQALSQSDQIAFIKAIAMVEDRVGSLGSVSNLPRLLSLVDDPERALFDWVLRNSSRYYYSKGARSVSGYDLACHFEAERRAEGMRRDAERQLQDRKRIAEQATDNLYKAVRRGDLKAVRALVEKGADVTVSAPDGTSLIALAAADGNTEMVQVLEKAAKR
jgi:Ankyrin repeats (many copies)